jgi:hypothetical protein
VANPCPWMDPGYVHGCLPFHDRLYGGHRSFFSVGSLHPLPAGRSAGRIPDDRNPVQDLHRLRGTCCQEYIPDRILRGPFFHPCLPPWPSGPGYSPTCSGWWAGSISVTMKTRLRTIRILAAVFPVLWTIAFLLIKLPVLMVTIGGLPPL